MIFSDILKDYFFTFRHVMGIDCLVCEDDTFKFHYVILEKKRNSLIVLETNFNSINSADFLNKVLDFKGAISINIRGKGVLERKIENATFSNNEEALSKIYPVARIEDFYINYFNGSNNSQFVQVARWSYCKEIISKVGLKLSKISCVLLGSSPIQNFAKWTDSTSGIFQANFNNYCYTFEDGLVKDIAVKENSTDDIFKISNLDLNAEKIHAYCAGITYFSDYNINGGQMELIANSTNLKYTIAIRRSILPIIISIFFIGIVNLFFYLKYFETNEELLTQSEINISSQLEINKLKSELIKSKNLVEKSGLNIKTEASFIIDQIVFDMPSGISLELVEIFKCLNRNQNDSILKFNNKQLFIRGNTDESVTLNDWIKILKDKQIIREVSLSNYVLLNEIKKGKFEIVIDLNEVNGRISKK